MTFWAVVPVKPLRRSKSRLSEVLSREQRASLSEEMLVHMLQVLEQVPAIERTLVVSRDSQALSLARRHGARTVTERGSPDLNNALIRATLVAKTYGAAGVLVLPADLPLITKEDVLTLLELGREPPVVVIVPDRHKTGTNALLTSPPGFIAYDFGPESFSQHVARAKAAGARLEVCEIASVGLDLDLPEDLAVLREGKGNGSRLIQSIQEDKR